MNKLSQEKIQQIRQLIRQGYSRREIGRRVGASKNAVQQYALLFRDEYPNCDHGVPLYQCPACFNKRRSVRPDGTIEYRIGPAKRSLSRAALTQIEKFLTLIPPTMALRRTNNAA